MIEIPKPTGYDFKLKIMERSDHVEGTQWRLPEDVLFSVSQMISEHPPKGAFLVCWYTPEGDNSRLKLKFQGCQDHDCQLKALAAEIASYLLAP